jgi:Tfp pilus assembly protein PilZ
MPFSKENNRRGRHDERFDWSVKVDLRGTFAFETDVTCHCLDDGHQVRREKGHQSGFTKNISAQGICLVTPSPFPKGQAILLELVHPSSKKLILMEGQVRWSRPVVSQSVCEKHEVGVKIHKVNGQDVECSVMLDPVYHTLWSIVLESVFAETKHTLFRGKRSA